MGGERKMVGSPRVGREEFVVQGGVGRGGFMGIPNGYR
jgi:hypothetical protein